MHVVGGLEGVHQGDLLLADHLQPLVGDDDQAVHVHQQVGDALFGQAHLSLALKGKGLGDDAHRQDPQVMGHLCHHRGRTGAGAAAHAGRDKDHLRPFEHIGDLVLALLCRALAHFRVGAGAAALGQLGAQLHLDGGMVFVQGLLVGVHRDELHSLQPVGHHPVDGVAAAAAHAHHLDGRYVFVHFFVKHQSHSLVPPSGNMVTGQPPGTGPPSRAAQIIL